jgi:hypothetical protein
MVIMTSHKFLPEQYRFRGAVGDMKQFSHEVCSDSRERLYVTVTPTGWIFHCHNCAPKMSGFFRDNAKMLPSPEQTVTTLALLTRYHEVVDASSISLPHDFTTQLHPEGARWLLKYGITEEEKKKYSIGYSPSFHRLILPIIKEGVGVTFWQGRNLGEISRTRPKYKSVQAKGTDKLFEIIKDDRGKVVIVEDILSAIILSRQGVSAIALLGSYMPYQLYERLNKYSKIGVWLDSDKYDESVRISKRLREFGHVVTTLHTHLDPKEVTEVTARNLTNF